MLGATCPRLFFLFFSFFLNHKKSRQNREGHHDDECGKRVGVSVLIKKTRKSPRQKRKGEKSSQFLSGYISQAPWNLGPISISFIYNPSLFGNSLTHCPSPPPPLPHFLTHLQLKQQQY
jgi:hypothetical protein